MAASLYIILLFLLLAALSNGQFNTYVEKGKVDSGDVDEVSGMVVSHVHSDVIYVHNDKGDSSRLFALNVNNGVTLAELTVDNVRNYDWEDLTYGPCADDCRRQNCSSSVQPLRYCIYIAETGDHGGDGAVNNIYMIREPDVIQDQHVTVVDTLKFSWTEPDCETLMIDPTGQLYIMSKVDNGGSRMAALPSSAWGGQRVNLDMTQAATCKVFTTHNDPQGGDISPDGKEMVLVFEDDVYYYSVPGGDYIKAVNTIDPARLTSYHRVPSTEAIAWDKTGLGFYTLAEGKHQRIYYYLKTVKPGIGK